MAEITISELPAKTSLLDSDLIVIDDGTQSYRVTGAQLREFLKVNFLSVGTVVWSQSALATDNPGRLPLWTGEYIASASTIYPDFYTWVKDKHPELCKTKEQYDAALTQFGECPFYVVDEEEGSLRLPKLTNYIKMANAAEGITQSEAGLPNITGRFACKASDSATPTGAFLSIKTGGGSGDTYSSGAEIIDFDASLSSEVYGKSDTVTPSHTTLYPWVFAYNASVPASTAQAAEFQEGLSGKADTNLGNIPTNYDYVVEHHDDGQGNHCLVMKSKILIQYGEWKDRGNDTTVTYLQPFATIPTLLFANVGYNNYRLGSTTATSFKIVDANHGADSKGCSWFAIGKGA